MFCCEASTGEDGKRLKWLPTCDEFTRESVALEVERRMEAKDVVRVLERAEEERGAPACIRSDNGPEPKRSAGSQPQAARRASTARQFGAKAVRERIAQRGFETRYIEPGSPWQNAYSESFNARLRDELLNIECFGTLAEAKVLGKEYRRGYDEHRSRSSLNYQAPTEFARRCFWLIPLRSISQRAAHLPHANPTPKQSRQPPQDSHKKWIKFRGHPISTRRGLDPNV